MRAAIQDRFTMLLARQLHHMVLDPLVVMALVVATSIAVVWTVLILWRAC